MSIVMIHGRLATTGMLFAGICVAWGLLNFLRKQPMTGSYWGALVILEALMIIQVVLGAVVYFSGGQLARPIVHFLYAATAILSLPAAYVYTGGKDTQRESLLYAVVCLWLLFIVDRSRTTGMEMTLPALGFFIPRLITPAIDSSLGKVMHSSHGNPAPCSGRRSGKKRLPPSV